ncbi:piggyBac transposable element-derived protein 4-like [Ctenocephalides felis]|uniref:piggyBac transposable element-derived protein 4-like n=1 Tax=Ctenocephalides felis TaxID=7515 RepID=UPI000E6E3DEC|nr:piggyBac transposable element-derived protein 4-like [Ctenocephalides felis]
MLHLHENDPNNQSLNTRTQKVSHYLDYLDQKFRQHYVPSREISVDKSVVGFKGKISFITYNPNKPTKWGIRIYVMADANTGYVYTILPYYGSLTSHQLVRPDLPVTTRIVLNLCQKLLDYNPGCQGHHFYTDRYYTSIPLAEELLKLNVYLTGTIQTNRKFIPDCIKKPIFAENNMFAFRSGKLMLLAWKDKRIVTTLTSWDISGTQPIHRRIRGGNVQVINKPNVVINYNKFMGGVDRADSYSASYCFLRKSMKWWQKLFFWDIEMSSVNAFLLYKNSQRGKNKPMTHLKFVRELVDVMTKKFSPGVQISWKAIISRSRGEIEW